MLPSIFIGHGSPLNALEDNEFTKSWAELGKRFPNPKAVLMISSHWYTPGNYVLATDEFKMIYDFYGYPFTYSKEMYKVEYPAKTSREVISRVQECISCMKVTDGGLDSGAWMVLRHMYPDANVPVVMLSLNRNLTPMQAYELGQQLSELRKEDILIIGSGNVLHNLTVLDPKKQDGFDWGNEFDSYVKKSILSTDVRAVAQYEKAVSSPKYAPFISMEHYLPLMYAWGAVGKTFNVEVFNEKVVMGSVSMTSYIFND